MNTRSIYLSTITHNEGFSYIVIVIWPVVDAESIDIPIDIEEKYSVAILVFLDPANLPIPKRVCMHYA